MSTPQQGPQPNFEPGGPVPLPPYGQQPMVQGQPPAPVPAPAKPKRFGWLALGLTGAAALILGAALGGAGNGASTAAPAPTVTVTQTAPAAAPAATEEPSDEPTEDTYADDTYSAKKSDFEIDVKTLSKECFGSAGCNVTFRIKPSYVGDQTLPTSGEIEVSYKITGLEDPVENVFTVDGEGTITYTKEEDGQTESKGDKLGAKVTDVEYTP